MRNPEREGGRIYIIGAGFAGRAIAREIRNKAVFGTVVAFLDDDAAKIGGKVEGIPVLGPIRDVVNLLRRTPADEAIIAIPSATKEFLRELYFLLKRAGFVRIRIVPGIAQIVEGDAHLIQAREIESQDLLGRSPVADRPQGEPLLPEGQARPHHRGRRLDRLGAFAPAPFGGRRAALPLRPRGELHLPDRPRAQAPPRGGRRREDHDRAPRSATSRTPNT